MDFFVWNCSMFQLSTVKFCVTVRKGKSKRCANASYLANPHINTMHKQKITFILPSEVISVCCKPTGRADPLHRPRRRALFHV